MTFPRSLEWFYISLAELVPAAKTFEWAPLEKHLTAIAARGYHATPGGLGTGVVS